MAKKQFNTRVDPSLTRIVGQVKKQSKRDKYTKDIIAETALMVLFGTDDAEVLARADKIRRLATSIRLSEKQKAEAEKTVRETAPAVVTEIEAAVAKQPKSSKRG